MTHILKKEVEEEAQEGVEDEEPDDGLMKEEVLHQVL